MNEIRQRTATHAPTRKSDVYLKLGARPLAPLYRRIDKLLAAGEPFVTVHALGKAVPRAKKLADGVAKRRGDDVKLDVSTESVTVFDDVFPSGESLETALPQSRRRSVSAIHIKISKVAVEKQVAAIATVFPAPPTPVEAKPKPPKSASASSAAPSATPSAADSSVGSSSQAESRLKSNVSSLQRAYNQRDSGGGGSGAGGSQSGSSNPFAALQQSKSKGSTSGARSGGGSGGGSGAPAAGGVNAEAPRALTKSQRRNQKKKEKRRRQLAEAAAAGGNTQQHQQQQRQQHPQHGGYSSGRGYNPSWNKRQKI